MAELPEMQIQDKGDVADWRYQASLFFPDDVVVRLDLRLHGESEYRPQDTAVIEVQLRNQRSLDNMRPVLDQAREWAREPIYLGFFQ